MRYLVTPEADEYLKLIQIDEILETHECLTTRNFSTSDIKLDIGGESITLFHIMLGLKDKLSCRFDFKFSETRQQIVMACYLPKGYLLAAFVIYEDRKGKLVTRVP